MPTPENLRKNHPKFIYEDYSWEISTNNSVTEFRSNLEITFHYSIEPGASFSPTLVIKNVPQEMLDRLGKERIDSYIFNIGLAEMFSYWKSTTSPIIEINAGKLDQDQIDWWHKLLIKGMGEYFFVNNIKFTDEGFVKIESNSEKNHLVSTQDHGSSTPDNNQENKILIPIGGGKDSSVTLEILENLKDIGTFVVNPTQAALDTISVSEIKNNIEVDRTIDPKLLELNKKGYLNGHVPISAFFAFLSIFCADLFGYSHVAISNERSSNEGNVQFCDKEINHQYSKTYEFENDFQEYTKKYLPENTPLYFSFLRPLYELQIAEIFARMDKYHPVFKSCNRGQKTNSWCGECSKCLFAYVIIFPFMENQKIHSFFGKDMFADNNLWPIAQELLGIGEKKPLECVGTHEETIAAFYLSIKKYVDSDQKLPLLLQIVQENIMKNEENLEERSQAILSSWNEENSIPKNLEEELKKHV
jgi:UDP-N-acetyl-alpha-D-muramoyl-L-alanyl-L-glutamate epimerase